MQLLEQLVRTHGEGPEARITRALLHFLSKHPTTSHINIQLIKNIDIDLKNEVSDKTILKTLQLLIGLGLLEMNFEVLDSDEIPHDIRTEVAKEAIANKINPLTGQVDEEIEKKILYYFSPINSQLNAKLMQ
jgi:hypothetical protein